jgi:hypothetical protein
MLIMFIRLAGAGFGSSWTALGKGPGPLSARRKGTLPDGGGVAVGGGFIEYGRGIGSAWRNEASSRAVSRVLAAE